MKALEKAKKHNDRIKNEQPEYEKKWRSEGLSEELIWGRVERFFGDFTSYDKQLHDDIDALLKYLKAEDINVNEAQ